jgi:hypothetical protein
MGRRTRRRPGGNPFRGNRNLTRAANNPNTRGGIQAILRRLARTGLGQ